MRVVIMPILFLLAAHEVDTLTASDTSRHHDYSYCQTSNISRTLVSNKIADHSDVVGASPVGAAPTASSFSAQHLASVDCTKTTARWDEKHLSFGI